VKVGVSGAQTPGPDGGCGGLQAVGQSAPEREQPQGLLLGLPTRPAAELRRTSAGTMFPEMGAYETLGL
jgi:hypothetical protein